jgi:hypothetical protein
MDIILNPFRYNTISPETVSISSGKKCNKKINLMAMALNPIGKGTETSCVNK